MDVGRNRSGAVVVDDEVDALEIQAAPNQLCCNKNPHFSGAEVLDDGLTLYNKLVSIVAVLQYLRLRSLSMNNVNVQSIVNELLKQSLGVID